MLGGPLRVLWLLPPLKLVAMIELKVAVSTIKIKIKSKIEPRLNNGYAMYHIPGLDINVCPIVLYQ